VAQDSLDLWLATRTDLSGECVGRFLALEEQDPHWSRRHDPERGLIIDELHQMGCLREARALVHRWLLGYQKQLAGDPSREAARREQLWRCLADVVERTADQQLLELFWTSLSGLTANPQWSRSSPLPLMGIPILNRFDLLEQLLDSLDYPIQQLAIVDNSGGEGQLGAQLKDLQNQGHPMIETICIAHPFRNLGVAGSWNHILTSFPEACITLMVNNDVRFAPQAIETALQQFEITKPCFLPMLPGGNAFSAFLINNHAWDCLGLFDESFYPAYCEDVDYRERLAAHPQTMVIQNSNLQQSMAEFNQQTSATITSDSALTACNAYSFQLNRLWLLSRRRLLHDPRGAWLRRWLNQWQR